MESAKRNNATTSPVVTSINPNSMEAAAATKIQAGFRGYQVRKQLRTTNNNKVSGDKSDKLIQQ